MSDHDALMSHAVALKRELEQYLEEYDPWNGDDVLSTLNHAIIKMSKMPQEVPLGKQ